jgi:uncharacterized damage-inducible protein DinB
MNSIIEQEFEEGYPGIATLRDQLMEILSDEDLAYKLPGHNPTLGELCEELGYHQQIYVHSFKTFKQEWDYRASEPTAPNSVASLQAWYKKMDAELYEALSALSEADIHHKQIDRGHGFTPSPFIQFQIYHEAHLIFYAKVSVYLKALEKQLTDDWKIGIG